MRQQKAIPSVTGSFSRWVDSRGIFSDLIIVLIVLTKLGKPRPPWLLVALSGGTYKCAHNISDQYTQKITHK